jgi:adenylate cyclase
LGLEGVRVMEFEPAIAAHRGGIFKLMGDGLLAEFASVVDVVNTQRGMAEQNFGEPKDQRIDLTSGGPRSIPS